MRILPQEQRVKEVKTFGKISEEDLILQALKENPLHIEKIIEKTGLKRQKILSILAIMETKGIIHNMGNNIYASTHQKS